MMNLTDLMRMSSANLRRRKLRTFLTVLGVVIGTSSIVVMLSLGIGMKESLYQSFEEGGGLTGITVISRNDDENKYITKNAIDEIANIDGVKLVSPVINIDAEIIKGKYRGYVLCQGLSLEGLEKMGLSLKKGGRLPKKGSFESVIGNTVITNMSEDYWETKKLPEVDFLKDTVFLTFNNMDEGDMGEEIGDGNAVVKKLPKKYVLKPSGLIDGKPEGFSMTSSSIFFEVSGLERMLKNEFKGRIIPGQPLKKGKPLKEFVYNEARVFADDVNEVENIQEKINDLGFDAQSNKEMLDSIQKEFAVVEAILGGIGAVSFLVAAIGIANTMMMSIYERTKEIGVIKVLGCDMKDIRRMFLMEAASIGFWGGIIGNALSMLISKGLNFVSSSNMEGLEGTKISVIPPWLILSSIIFSVIMAMIAGFFPSRRAMKLSPLAAIRQE